MAKLTFTAAAALALLATGGSAETIWSSVAYIMHGDRTPILGYPTEALTPLGAQQLYNQGMAFRARYLSNNSVSENVTKVVPFAGIRGMNEFAIVDSALSVHAIDQQAIAGGAMAFMQALYPPKNMTFALENGGQMAATRVGGGIHLQNSLYQFPGDGYQFPRIQTASILDPDHIWLDAHNDCRKYVEQANAFQTTDLSARATAESSAAFYKALVPGVFPPSRLNAPSDFQRYYYQANELYNYALYSYHHNATARNFLTGEKLAYTRLLASMQQRSLHGNVTYADKTAADKKVRAIAGRTFATRALKALRNRSITGRDEDKLTLLFGGPEAFTAFFTLAGLVDGPSKANFESVPEPGAAMVFELFSVDEPGAAARDYPAPEDLWVRFMYRSGTSEDLQFVQYSIFGSPNSQSSMKLNNFAMAMQNIGVSSPTEWCQVCGYSGQICAGQGYSGSEGASSGSSSGGWGSSITPPVAGAIGAVVTLAVVASGFMAAMVLGGFRIRKAGSNVQQVEPQQQHPSPRGSGLGGFKGAEKMASDTDLAMGRGGIRHERTGSWELREGGKVGADQVHEPPSPAGASFDKDIAVASTIRRDRDDDAVSVLSEMNMQPVRPRESV